MEDILIAVVPSILFRFFIENALGYGIKHSAINDKLHVIQQSLTNCGFAK